VKHLEDRSAIDVSFTRGHLVSQWPLMLHEWLFAKQSARDWPGMLESWLRVTIAMVLLFALQFGSLWALGYVAGLTGLPAMYGAALAISAFAVLYGSFLLSVRLHKPVGLFWLAALIERRFPPTRRRAAHAARDRDPAPADRRRAATKSLPAPHTARPA
jgi:hypothetical protein